MPMRRVVLLQKTLSTVSCKGERSLVFLTSHPLLLKNKVWAKR